jgi:deoxyribodipyrimidine photo-lyase
MSKRVEYIFPTDMDSIMARVDNINPTKYAKTRNFTDGDVTYLSPFISRGIISVKQIKDNILKRGYKLYEVQKFIQELAWREYWQRIWQSKGDEILQDLKQFQLDVVHTKIPTALQDYKTGIDAIDNYIKQLYEQGYMHNHIRMYVASITCNIARAHWLLPAQWLYYHLLDGDIASNHLSWQWVCGSASSKKYFANQENINKYTGSNQQNSFLDTDYGSLTSMPVPEALQATTLLSLQTILPNTGSLKIDNSKPTCIYNSYNLDTLWRKDENVNRVLLLEPSHFKKYPVSEKVLSFIINLSKNMEGITIFVGEFKDIQNQYENPNEMIFFKEHPAFTHYIGICDSRDWLAPNTTGYFNSFFSFWKNAEKELQEK